MAYMLRRFAGLLGGACLAAILVVLVLTISSNGAEAVRSVELGGQDEVHAGNSRAMVQVEAEGDAAVLHLLVLASADDSEMITTRVRLQDGQQFAMSVASDEDQDRANRFVFTRSGKTILAQGIPWSDTDDAAKGMKTRTASVGSFW